MLTGDAQRSAGVMVRPYRVAAHSINVDAIQEPVQLLARQLDYGLLPSWPDEVVSFPLFFVFQGSNIMPPDSSPAESRSSLA